MTWTLQKIKPKLLRDDLIKENVGERQWHHHQGCAGRRSEVKECEIHAVSGGEPCYCLNRPATVSQRILQELAL